MIIIRSIGWYIILIILFIEVACLDQNTDSFVAITVVVVVDCIAHTIMDADLVAFINTILAFHLVAFNLAYLPFDIHIQVVTITSCLGVVVKIHLAFIQYHFSQVLCSSWNPLYFDIAYSSSHPTMCRID